MTKNVANNVANEKVQDYVKKSHNMTEKELKSEKTTQDVQKKCLSLTEQYEVGGTIICAEGSYVYTENGIEKVHYCQVGCITERITPKANIIAPVPSYLQWNAMLESNDSLVQTINALKNRLVEVAEENAKLKETIKRTKANGNYPSRVSAYKSRIATLCEENAKLKELLKECRDVIYNLIDDEPCWLDHHGYCQTHGWMSEDLCPNEGGKELLTKIDEVLK